jgi:hypothetical protein
VVTDPPITVTAGPAFKAVEGTLSAPQTVATFTDPAGYEPNADYSAVINWGDGTTSTGTIRNGAVIGSHRYAEESAADHLNSNPYTITVTVQHEANAPVTVRTTAVVADPQITVTAGPIFRAVEGALSAVQTVATFTDPAGYESNADYTATIAWGDGSTSAGTVSKGVVTGSHKYAEESSPNHTGGAGAYTVTVTVRHEANAPVTVRTAAVVADPAVLGKAVAVSAVEGTPFTSAVTTFTDPGGSEPLSDYSATIAWGDGTTVAGRITFAGGIFTVTGSHTYAEEGSFPVTVTVHHEAAPVVTVSSRARVADAPLTVLAQPGLPLAFQNVTTGTVVVATFRDANPGALVWDFRPTSINWGDGTVSAGTVQLVARAGAGATFRVVGSHTFVRGGTFHPTVLIPDVGGQRAAAVDTVNVATDVSGQVMGGRTPQGGGSLAYVVLVQNASSQNLRGPFQVAFSGLDPRIQLAGASLGGVALSVGKTAAGTPYATIPAGVLTKGGSFNLKVWFSDPLGLPVGYRLKIFADLP